MESKFVLVLAVASLAQICYGDKSFAEILTLSSLNKDIAKLTADSKEMKCFQTVLRVPYYYAVKNFTSEILTSANPEGNMKEIANTINPYPGKMVKYIEGKDLSTAKNHMINTKDKIAEYYDKYNKAEKKHEDAIKKVLVTAEKCIDDYNVCVNM